MSICKRVVRAADQEARRLGALVSFERGKKHPEMVITLAGQSRRIAVSSTPRTDRDNQIDWVRQDVRRLVRELR